MHPVSLRPFDIYLAITKGVCNLPTLKLVIPWSLNAKSKSNQRISRKQIEK